MTNHISDEVSSKPMVLIDGGWLLHRMRWKKVASFGEIVDSYVSYIEKRFDLTTVIFDGYEKSTIKDNEHERRSSAKVSATMTPKPDMWAPENQDAFLSNANNKTQLIKMLAKHLEKNHSVQISEGDADILLVKEAMNFARNAQSVTVVADDTDIFVLLVHHWKQGMASVYLHMEGRTTKKEQSRLYDIKEACGIITPAQKDNILFIHAWP